LRWESRSAEQPASPEDIVQAVVRPGIADALLARLQRPSDARFLIRDRMPLERRAKLLRIDAPEAKLQEYVVLVWPTKEARERAQAVLSRDRLVLNVAENVLFTLSAAPLDPLYPRQSVFRWNETLSPGIGSDWVSALPADQAFNQSLESAWDWVHGTAYVAVLDTGIQLQPSIHPDLEFLFRPHFSQNVFTAEQGKVDEFQGLPAGTDTTGFFVGHGTHVAGILAADTRRAGVPEPFPPIWYNPVAEGVSGACWFCSSMVQKITVWEPGATGPSIRLESMVAGLYRTAVIGAQVASMSFGRPRDGNFEPLAPYANCDPDNPLRPADLVAACLAIYMAQSRDVLMFAAAGNKRSELVQWPANSAPVVPVAGLDRFGDHWIERNESNELTNTGSIAGPEIAARGLAALARDVPSTFYTGRVWNAVPTDYGRCSDLPTPPEEIDDLLGVGYGRCTGTSMSTPFVAGIGALLRSVDPLRTAGQIADTMRATASNASAPNQQIGFGRPQPMSAVNALLQSTNRLTPLFAFLNAEWGDRFYTVVPQMAAAATQDTMALRDEAKDFRPYVPEGTVISGYPQFPSWEGGKQLGPTPRAQVWVFSTPRNPFNSNVELLPIFRLSYACYSNPTVWKPQCAVNGRHIDHAYTTDLSQVHPLNTTGGYLIDGIEGYLVPPTEPQPDGTVRMYRGVKDGDWALFPENLAGIMSSLGYTVSWQNLGWAFPNTTGVRPSY
jgi:subtilisin family serine protease